jgi:hypothetical protein
MDFQTIFVCVTAFVSMYVILTWLVTGLVPDYVILVTIGFSFAMACVVYLIGYIYITFNATTLLVLFILIAIILANIK